MKCRRHPFEVGVGVCASCLRERLVALIAEQNELAADDLPCRRLESYPSPSNPPHLSFPRSVSPYISHRRSLGSDYPAPNRRLSHFFSTPLVGSYSSFSVAEGDRKPRRSFSIWSAVFGHSRSDHSEPRSSSSWLSALKRKKKSRNLPTAAEHGMPHAKYEEERNHRQGSGYSSDSSPGRRFPAPTPMRSSAARRSCSGGSRGVSGFAVCLSPLVRPSPQCRRGGVDSGISSDIRLVGNHKTRLHASSGEPATLATNRSKKLADFAEAALAKIKREEKVDLL
ncbi:hypothetical protein HPP92_025149 [Vanilla planifolia]|uniref:Uncharacterized protein n=1 Tax=Vanilla planifolia TaxID=51239 RepID=A0A835PHC1_VANPL|nr:hypothetical protein HPP92_025455 [Vanilla planifolia]KAG0453845.1 hypothetical protein HPP92_025149 [Vanilla planifolia]